MMIRKAIAILLFTLVSANVLAGGDKGKSSDAQQARVEDLPVCYARGTDTIGRAVDTAISGVDPEDPVNIGNPNFDAALALYRSCFSEDFSFTLAFDGVPILTVPNPDTRTENTDAALQWANFVNNAFRGPGYKSTQHHMGSISSEVRGNKADIVSYLIATHAYGPNGAQPAGSVSVVGGTYTDKAVFKHGNWLLEERTLNITSSVVTLAQ